MVKRPECVRSRSRVRAAVDSFGCRANKVEHVARAAVPSFVAAATVAPPKRNFEGAATESSTRNAEIKDNHILPCIASRYLASEHRHQHPSERSPLVCFGWHRTTAPRRVRYVNSCRRHKGGTSLPCYVLIVGGMAITPRVSVFDSYLQKELWRVRMRVCLVCL